MPQQGAASQKPAPLVSSTFLLCSSPGKPCARTPGLNRLCHLLSMRTPENTIPPASPAQTASPVSPPRTDFLGQGLWKSHLPAPLSLLHVHLFHKQAQPSTTSHLIQSAGRLRSPRSFRVGASGGRLERQTLFPRRKQPGPTTGTPPGTPKYSESPGPSAFDCSVLPFSVNLAPRASP